MILEADFGSVMPRYVFLVPPQDMRGFPAPAAPRRFNVEAAMKAAFRMFELPPPEQEYQTARNF